MKQEIISGYGSLRHIKKIVDSILPQRIVLFTGKKSYELSGASNILDETLSNYELNQVNDFSTNPRIEDVHKSIETYMTIDPDLVIAIGGGSVIDVAKMTNILSANENSPKDYITGKKRMTKKGNKFIAVPTTSGTGSESTHFSTVYIGMKKYSLAHPELMLPDIVIIDSQLTMSMPKRITASTGIDAVSQGIESYWSANSTEESKEYAKEAITLSFNNLEKVYHGPDTLSREKMATSANLSGRAINISKTTGSHALSYPLHLLYGLDHGHAVAMTIPSMIRFNGSLLEEDTTDRRGHSYVKKTMQELYGFLDADNPENAARNFELLMKNIGLETRLSDVGLKEEKEIDTILSNFNIKRLTNNPRRITNESLYKMMHDIY